MTSKRSADNRDVSDEDLSQDAEHRSASLAVVHVELAADTTLVRLARLVVSGVASVAGMHLDEVEACRAAIDEMCSALLEVGEPSAVLSLHVQTDGHDLSAWGEMARSPEHSVDPIRDHLSQLILESMVDEHDIEVNAVIARFRFLKRGITGEAIW